MPKTRSTAEYVLALPPAARPEDAVVGGPDPGSSLPVVIAPCVARDRYDSLCGAESDPGAPADLCDAHLRDVFRYVIGRGRDGLAAEFGPPLQMPDPVRESVVYYARIGSSVKIGWSTRIDDRMKAINPEELMATEPGGRGLERQRHTEFQDLRTHGEWFRLHPRLEAHIKELKHRVADRGSAL